MLADMFSGNKIMFIAHTRSYVIGALSTPYVASPLQFIGRAHACSPLLAALCCCGQQHSFEL